MRKGRADQKGKNLKKAIGEFIEKMKPHLEIAQECGVAIAIENHGNSLIQSPDSIRWLLELSGDTPFEDHLGIALAPYHLPQDPQLLANLILDCDKRLNVFYAWQHGMGCMTKLPKNQELLQMPGRGDLDFGPLMQAMKQIDYQGWVSIFMHPVPRGIPILESTKDVTDEINRGAGVFELVCLVGQRC